jgi:GPH family glycoside/pentoside/hexuronide:cation symporter
MLPIAFVGVVLGYILPSMIFKYGDLNSYLIMAIVCVIVGIIGNIVMIPGMREDKESIERYLAKCEQIQKDSFIKVMKSCLKHKNFLAVILLYFLYQSMGTSLSASYQYLVKYILKEQPIISTLLMLGMFAGALVSVPIWLRYANRTKNNKRTAIYGGIIIIIAIFPMIFVSNVIGGIIILFILGIGLGCFMIMIFPIFSDVIDEAVIKTHKRNEGTYLGIRFFFGRLALVVQAVSFAIVHISTGFVEGSDTQSPLAIIGIRIHLAVIPIILMTIGILIFAKMYDITPEKAAINKSELKKLGL